MTAMLEISHLSLDVSGKRILDDVSLCVEKGRTLALIGESGSGKSTTALSILGLFPNNSRIDEHSTIALEGRALPIDDDAAMRKHRGTDISIVFQDPMTCLNPFMRVGKQILEAIERNARLNKSERLGRMYELLEMVELPNPPETARRYPHELSGGQQQRIMIAMALAADPKLLIADEATRALDASVQSGILQLIKNFQSELGFSMLLITHDMAVAGFLAQNIAVMRSGAILETGPAQKVLHHPKHPYAQKLMNAKSELIDLNADPARTFSQEKAAQIEHGYFSYPAPNFWSSPKPVLKDISIDIAKGETLGILGESGSGKSTMSKLMSALVKPDKGSVRLFEADISKGGALPLELRRRCQIIFQNPFGALNPRLTIREALIEPLKLLKLDGPDTPQKLRQALISVNLPASYLDLYPHELSGGQRQRVCIARALLSEPELLICDEIVSALDPTVQVQVLKMLKALQRERGFAMLFISHDIDIVRHISDRIAVINKGEIVELGEAQALVAKPAHSYTRRLVNAASMLLTQAA